MPFTSVNDHSTRDTERERERESDGLVLHPLSERTMWLDVSCRSTGVCEQLAMQRGKFTMRTRALKVGNHLQIE